MRLTTTLFLAALVVAPVSVQAEDNIVRFSADKTGAVTVTLRNKKFSCPFGQSIALSELRCTKKRKNGNCEDFDFVPVCNTKPLQTSQNTK